MEVWKDIQGYEGLYQISSYGRVKSLSKVVNGKANKPVNKRERILKQQTQIRGYLSVTFSKQNKQKMFRVNRLVAQTFIPNPKNKKQVNHINAIKDDNRVENLEWVTNEENKNHAWENNLMPHGEKHFRTKMTDKDVRDMRRLKKFFSYKELSVIFDLDYYNVWRIVTKRSWKRI